MKCSGSRQCLERRYLAREFRQGNPEPVITRKKSDYHRYISSPEWYAKKEAAKQRDGYKCRALGCRKTHVLQVHHVRYPEKLGEEPLDWLVTLCTYHHMVIHRMEKKGGSRVTLQQATDKVLGIVRDITKIENKPVDMYRARLDAGRL